MGQGPFRFTEKSWSFMILFFSSYLFIRAPFLPFFCATLSHSPHNPFNATQILFQPYFGFMSVTMTQSEIAGCL